MWASINKPIAKMNFQQKQFYFSNPTTVDIFSNFLKVNLYKNI